MKALAHKLKNYLRVFVSFKKINFLERLAYRFSFYMLVSGVLIQLFFNLVFVKIIFSWVGNIKGWNYYEALLLVGTVMLLDGLLWMTCAFMHILRQHIKMGTLDAILTKPMDAQFLVSVYRGDLEDVVRTLSSFGVAIYAFLNLNISGWTAALNFLAYIVLVFCAFLIVYSMAAMFNCISFWTIEGPSTFMLADTILRVAQYPVDIYENKIVRFVFTFIVPLAFIGTVPVKIFSRGIDWTLIVSSLATAGVFVFVSRYVWKRGLEEYSSASS